LKVLYDELLLLGTEESALPRPLHDDHDKLPQFLRMQRPEGLLLGQETDHPLDQASICLIFIGIEVHIEDLLKDGEGDQRIDVLIGDKLSELRMDLPQDESIGVLVDLRGHHHLDLSPRRFGQDHLLLLPPSGVLVEQAAHIALADHRLRPGQDLRTEEILLRGGTDGLLFAESLEDVVAKAAPVAGGNLLGNPVDLRRPSGRLLLGPIHLHPQLLYLKLLCPLVALLIMDNPL